MLKSTLLSIITHRELIWEMAKRDLKGSNKGALLGYLWLFLSPFIQTMVYVIVVLFIFKVRLSESTMPLNYLIYVLSGMIPWQILTRTLQEAPSIIRERIELVKQVIYPIETLPLTGMVMSSFSFLISLCILLILSAAFGTIKWTVVLLPIPFLLLTLFILGVSWILSIVGVLIKDLREIVFVILGLMVYVSPVVVNEAIVGANIWNYIMLNPFAHIIISFRDIFYATFHPLSWIIFTVISLMAFILGGWVITKTKIMINEYI